MSVYNDDFFQPRILRGLYGSIDGLDMSDCSNHTAEEVDWWGTDDSNLATVWYHWAAPRDGWYKFSQTEESTATLYVSILPVSGDFEEAFSSATAWLDASSWLLEIWPANDYIPGTQLDADRYVYMWAGQLAVIFLQSYVRSWAVNEGFSWTLSERPTYWVPAPVAPGYFPGQFEVRPPSSMVALDTQRNSVTYTWETVERQYGANNPEIWAQTWGDGYKNNRFTTTTVDRRYTARALEYYYGDSYDLVEPLALGVRLDRYTLSPDFSADNVYTSGAAWETHPTAEDIAVLQATREIGKKQLRLMRPEGYESYVNPYFFTTGSNPANPFPAFMTVDGIRPRQSTAHYFDGIDGLVEGRLIADLGYGGSLDLTDGAWKTASGGSGSKYWRELMAPIVMGDGIEVLAFSDLESHDITFAIPEDEWIDDLCVFGIISEAMKEYESLPAPPNEIVTIFEDRFNRADSFDYYSSVGPGWDAYGATSPGYPSGGTSFGMGIQDGTIYVSDDYDGMQTFTPSTYDYTLDVDWVAGVGGDARILVGWYNESYKCEIYYNRLVLARGGTTTTVNHRFNIVAGDHISVLFNATSCLVLCNGELISYGNFGFITYKAGVRSSAGTGARWDNFVITEAPPSTSANQVAATYFPALQVKVYAKNWGNTVRPPTDTSFSERRVVFTD